MCKHTATFRFYEELNEFLPQGRRKRDVAYRFKGKPSVKQAIEAHHVTHTEVDLILINEEPSCAGGAPELRRWNPTFTKRPTFMHMKCSFFGPGT